MSGCYIVTIVVLWVIIIFYLRYYYSAPGGYSCLGVTTFVLYVTAVSRFVTCIVCEVFSIALMV